MKYIIYMIINFLAGLVLFLSGIYTKEIVVVIGGLICLIVVSCAQVILERIDDTLKVKL